VLRLGWNIVRILLGIIFAIIGLSLIFALVVGIFGLFGPVYSNGSGVILDLPVVISAMVGNGISLGLLTLSVLVFLGVPSLLIFYSGLRMAFRIPKVPYAGMTAFNIWLVSFIILIYLGFKISNNYRVPQTFAQKDAVIGTNGPDTLYLQLNTALADSLKDTPIAASIDEPVMYVTGKGTVMLKPVLSIVPSDDTLFHLTRNITARGRSQAEALRYARSVKCDYVLRDSLLVIDPVALLPEGEAMQARNVRFRLEVPVGKTVAFDSTVCRIIDPETNPFPVGLCGIKCRMTPEGLEEIRPAGHPGKE
jgi:hypothetical protein